MMTIFEEIEARGEARGRQMEKEELTKDVVIKMQLEKEMQLLQYNDLISMMGGITSGQVTSTYLIFLG